ICELRSGPFCHWGRVARRVPAKLGIARSRVSMLNFAATCASAMRRLHSMIPQPRPFLTGICLALLMGLAPCLGCAADTDYHARVVRILQRTPLIDGHNDLPWEIRTRMHGQLAGIDLKTDTSKLRAPTGEAPLMTDIPRLRAGMV